MPRKVPTAVAARILGKSENFIRFGLQQGRLPFGSAVKTAKDRWSYHISPLLLANYSGVALGQIITLIEDNSLTEVKAHTLGRNTGAVGVSLCCCGDASATADGSRIDLGSEPPTAQQIESLAEVVAVLADEFDLPLDTDEYVMTHYEAAKRDGYAPGQDSDCRWDLWFIPDYYGAEGALTEGGALIRGKAAWYQRKWRGEFMGD